MFWFKLKTFFQFKNFHCDSLIFILFFPLILMANEGAPPAAEGGGHGGGVAPAKVEDYSGSQSDEWQKIEKDLAAAKQKYENDKKAYDDLKPAEGHSEHGSSGGEHGAPAAGGHGAAAPAAGGGHGGGSAPAASAESLSEQVKKAKEALGKSTSEYNKLLEDYKSRYPEKGFELGRKYERINETDEDLEKQDPSKLNLEKKLKLLNKKIQAQYPGVKKSVQEKKATIKKNSDSDSAEDLVDPVVKKIKIEK